MAKTNVRKTAQPEPTKRRVLVFGEKVFGPTKFATTELDYCTVEFMSFPGDYDKLGNLFEYDLVILDYAAFLGERTASSFRIYRDQQEVFEKSMLAALENGTSFCFLHYNEEVPEFSGVWVDGGMEEKSKAYCESFQIGFRWLLRYSIRPVRATSPIIHAGSIKPEFKHYQEHWGASRNI